MEKVVAAPTAWLREIEVTIERDRLNSRVDELLAEYGPKAVVPGFRPGRVSATVLRRRLGPALETGAVEELVEAAATEAISEIDVIPASRPRLIDLQVDPDKTIRFRLSVEVVPDFELRDWQGLKLKKEVPTGFEDEFQRRLDALREKCARFQPVNRPARTGDFVLVDYRTIENGNDVVPPRQNVLMHIGDPLQPEPVNLALEGASPGEERQAQVTFPDDYPDRNIAGHTRQYLFRVHEVKERIVPEVDEQLARDLGYADLDSMRREINEGILQDRAELVRNGLKNQVFDLLVSAHDFEPPQTWVESSLQRLRTQYDLPDDDDTRARLEPIARKWAKFDCIVARIARMEKIAVTDDETHSFANQIAAETGQPLEEVIQLLDSPAWRNQLLRDKVMDRILEAADVT